jgi:hypothetical protein
MGRQESLDTQPPLPLCRLLPKSRNLEWHVWYSTVMYVVPGQEMLHLELILYDDQ